MKWRNNAWAPVLLHGSAFANHTLELISGRRPVDGSTRAELEQAVQSAL